MMLDSLIERPILSIDWDARTLRIVHALAKGKSVRIDQVLSVAIPDGVVVEDAESLGKLIQEALHESGIRTKRALVDIPRDQANFYTLNLPKAAPDDMARMVALQIPKELPFPVDQAAIDFALPPDSDGPTCDVLTAAVLKVTLGYYRRVAERAGLKLERVGLRPKASQVAINALLETTPYKHVLFIDVGPSATEIDIIRDGRLVFSRAANVDVPATFDLPTMGAASTKDGESPEVEGDRPFKLGISGSATASSGTDAVVKELLIEVTRSIEAYRVTEAGARMDHAVIGGGCDIEEALSEAIQKRFNISAQPYNPASCFGWDADRGAAAGAFAATIGLALSHVREQQEQFDFLHPKRAESRAQRGVKQAPIAAVIAFLFIFAGVVGYVKGVRPEYERRDSLRAEIRAYQQELEAHDAFRKLVTAAREYEADQIIWLDVLHDVISTLPGNEEFVLKDSIDVSDKNRRIKIGFRAKSAAVADGVVRALKTFQTPDGKPVRFRARMGTTSEKGRGVYSLEGTLEVFVEDRSPSKTKSGRRTGRKG